MSDDMLPSRKSVSIICPVHNEELSIPIFFDRLHKVVTPLEERYRFELIFTNNASTDSSLEIIRGLRAAHPWVQVITLSRNFGYQASLTSGLRHADGDAIVIIDVDCEDPPELIPQFLEKWEEGHDIVYGERRHRPEPKPIQAMRKAFYRITRRIADADFILDMAEFSLFSGRVRDVVVANNSTHCFIRSEIAYAGFRRHAIPYDRQPRAAGETHYNFVRMTQFALAGILTASTFPLRAVAYTGLPLLFFDFMAVIVWLISGPFSWTNLLVLLNLMQVLFAAVVVSIYLARVYKDAVGRPLFVIDENLTFLDRPVEQLYPTR